jgi:manganese/zinc/iron transport system permease protein
VLVGELAFAPFDRFIVFGLDIGPRGLYLMLGILIINTLFITVFYKELKITTFDAGLATALGFVPALMHYGLMSLVSLTVVGAFDIVGSILVVALIVTPPAAAYLLTDDLGRMFGLSVFFGALAAVSGYWLAYSLDASIAGSIATMAGVIFAIVFLVAPERGLLSTARRRARQKWEFAQTMLAIHLFNHENTLHAVEESRFAHLREHMRWDEEFADKVVKRATEAKIIQNIKGNLILTEDGRERAQDALAN